MKNTLTPGRSSNALATFELTRPIVGISAIGIAQAAYEWTLEYLLGDGPVTDPIEEWLDESSTVGRPALERQHVQQVLADVATEIDGARLLVYKAARTAAQGAEADIAMARLLASGAAARAIDTALRLAGPAGYAPGSPLERLARDIRAIVLVHGTEERQRATAADGLLPQ